MAETVHPPQSLPLSLIQAWERAVIAVARLPRGTSRALEPRELLDTVVRTEQRAVLDLWEIFTQERRELRRQLLAHKREAVAYLLGFHLPNAARLVFALNRMQSRLPLSTALASVAGQWRWHDLGCGTGALAHAGLAHLKQAGFDLCRIDLNLVDASGVLLDMARALFAEVEGAPLPKTRKLALEDLPSDKFQHADGVAGSIYSLGYVWNELKKNRAAQSKLMKIWHGHLERKEPALIFMIEPATQDHCRVAMQWRDDMVDLGWTPLYPCPSAAPCPMLRRSRDWCYSEASWRRPRPMTQLDRYLELDRSQISATIFVMASPDLISRVQPSQKPASIVVGRPSHTDDYGFDYLICSGSELEKRLATRGAPIALRGESALLATPRSTARGKTQQDARDETAPRSKATRPNRPPTQGDRSSRRPQRTSDSDQSKKSTQRSKKVTRKRSAF